MAEFSRADHWHAAANYEPPMTKNLLSNIESASELSPEKRCRVWSYCDRKREGVRTYCSGPPSTSSMTDGMHTSRALFPGLSRSQDSVSTLSAVGGKGGDHSPSLLPSTVPIGRRVDPFVTSLATARVCVVAIVGSREDGPSINPMVPTETGSVSRRVLTPKGCQ